MASIVVFPTVATHRKLPHLASRSASPRIHQDDSLHSSVPAPGIDEAHGRAHALLDASSSTAATQQKTIALSEAPSYEHGQRLLKQGHDITDDNRPALALAINNNESMTPKILSGPGSTTTTPCIDWILQEHEEPSQSPGHKRQHLLNSPHGSGLKMSTPQSAIPLSGASLLSSEPSAAQQHESKMIKSALFDAFGCLYHPVQHTHQQSSSSTPSMTPLLGISPRESPILRPHLGASAPITPLELSADDGHSTAGGYFGIQTSLGTSSSSSPSSARPFHMSSHHHVSPHYRHHHHHRSQHSSRQGSGHHQPSGLTQDDGHFVPDNNNSNNSSTASTLKNLSRRLSVDSNLNPSEHPVLCSLQAFHLSKPHPSHRRLGHDLGRDQVSIESDECGLQQDGVAQAQTLTTTTQTQPQPQLQPSRANSSNSANGVSTLPLTPSGVLSIGSEKTSTSTRSPFPMDRDSPECPLVLSQQGGIV